MASPDDGVLVDLEDPDLSSGIERGGSDAEGDEDNLVSILDPTTLSTIGEKICEWVEADIESRKPWLERFEEGLKKAGIIGEPDPPQVEGGSVLVHPLLVEIAVQFQARAIEELYPADGPVKCRVVGESNDELEAQRDRVEAHMNWQIMEEDEENFDDMDALLFALPFAGSCFKKSYFDEECKYTTSKYVTAENCIIPYNAKSITRSPRVTHRYTLHNNEVMRLQKTGHFSESMLPPPQMDDEDSSLVSLADDSQPSMVDEDVEHTFYETSCEMAIEDDYPCPYLITVERDSRKVVRIQRNWREGDELKRRLTWFTHYKYLPGIGVYGFGLFHAIGGLGRSATGALRALLDSAAAANWQGGFVSNEARLPDKRIRLVHGTYQGLDMSPEEMRNAFYTPPFKEPSPGLAKALELIVSSGERFGSISEATVPEGGQNVPVGTTIARIEQATKVYSAIHKRNHRVLARELKIRASLNYEYLDETMQYSAGDRSLVIYREDYSEAIDIQPVSDPNITSGPQRIAIAEALAQRAAQIPFYNKFKVEERLLKALKVPSIEEILPEPNKDISRDPVTEGGRLLTSMGVKAYLEQNHQAHIQVHSMQMEMVKGTPAANMVMPAMLAHIQEHYALQYQVEMMQQLGIPLPPHDQDVELPPGAEAEISVRAAMVAQQQMQALAQSDPERRQAENEKTIADLKVQQEQYKTDRMQIDNQMAQQREQNKQDVASVMDQAKAMIAEAQRQASEQVAQIKRDMDKALAAAQAKLDQNIASGDVELVKAKMERQTKIDVAKIEAAAAEQVDKVREEMQKQIDALKLEVKEAKRNKKPAREN